MVIFYALGNLLANNDECLAPDVTTCCSLIKQVLIAESWATIDYKVSDLQPGIYIDCLKCSVSHLRRSFLGANTK